MEYANKLNSYPQLIFQNKYLKTITKPLKPCILKKYAWIIVSSIVAVLLLATTSIVIVHVLKHHKHSSHTDSAESKPDPKTRSSSGSLTRMCELTQYPDLCVTSLRQYIQNQAPWKNDNNNYDYHVNSVEISLNMTLERLRSSLDYFKKFDQQNNETFQWSANDDCVELLEDSVELLTRARPLLLLISSFNLATNNPDDHRYNEIQSYKTKVMTWMTTLCTNHDTCTEGFEEAGGAVKVTAQILQDLSHMLSISQGVTSTVLNDVVFSGRNLMGHKPTTMDHKNDGSPRWISRKNTLFLNTLLDKIEANITVSKEGIGPNVTVTTIREAIKMAPKHSVTPFIIHVKAGRYSENNLKVIKDKTNIWFIGDGKGKTIITGHRSVKTSNVTTMKTSTFGAVGDGFVARGITFENTAGPQNHQAVALFIKSDQSVVYNCEMKGYQDTLYVHSNRQFYRNCDIYGTVDFIFGYANAVFQNCSIYSLKPMENQHITITAPKGSSTCPKVRSGISIHNSRVQPAPDLEAVKSNYSTYLGRPWSKLSTAVYMLSFTDDHVDPQGWIPWSSNSTMDDGFCGEYMNYGPGSNTSQRLKAPSVHANLSTNEAMRFTVNEFLCGSSWINSTMVPFEGGL